ncbi:MAG: asparagine--tRNA ligase [Planctomycetota bacterium]
MEHVDVARLKEHVAKEVVVKGWLYNRRSSGKLHFLQVRDGTGIVQIVAFEPELPAELFQALGRLPQESSLIARGLVRLDPRSPGGVELQLRDATIVSEAEPYPITKKEHSVSFLMQNRHLWLRSRKQHAILRVRARIIRAIRDFFDYRGFVCVDAPIFTPAACEGTTTLFEVDYFGEKAYLTQSGQLYSEAAAMALGKVYCFGPTFRAERSDTRRHLTEFWMVEPEVAYATLDDVMDLAEDLVVSVVKAVLADSRAELAELERDVAKLEQVERPFPRLSYSEAVESLNAGGHPFEWGGDFGAPDETFLAERHVRPLLVHRFPAAVKAFYMKRDPQDDRLALGVDVLAPEGYGEIIGGGERSADLGYLQAQIKAHGLPEEAFDWYLDLRRYGSVPHAGFGMGLERCVAWICGTHHVRECIPFPRMLYRIYP